MVIKFKTVLTGSDRCVRYHVTQQGFEEENRKTLENIFEFPVGEKAAFVIEESVVACQEPDWEREISETEEVSKKDIQITKALEYAINDLKDSSSSLYKDLYCQYYPDEKTKGSFVEFGMMLIDAILAHYKLGTAISKYVKGSGEVAKATATIFSVEKGKALNRFEFFPNGKMWKDPAIEFKKNDKYVYPDFESYSMKDMDKDFVLTEIVPAFYDSLVEKKKDISRVHDLFDYHLECEDITGKRGFFAKLIGKA